MTAARRTFVDTNVLLYAHDASETERQPIARALLEELWADRSGVLSTQVLQEFYVVATRKFKPPMRRSEARELMALYAAWPVVQVAPGRHASSARTSRTDGGSPGRHRGSIRLGAMSRTGCSNGRSPFIGPLNARPALGLPPASAVAPVMRP